jgi:hypothetical protein
MEMNRSFGPAAILGDDGTVQICCVTKSTYCFLLVGGKCTDQKPAREIEDQKNTPDWCKYKAQTRADVEAARDFDRMGLTDLNRSELMNLMKDVPEQFRARHKDKLIPLNQYNTEMMRVAIRKMRLAEEAAA